MRVIRDNIWLCSDCTMGSCNGTSTAAPELQNEKATVEGLAKLEPHIVPDFDSETGEGLQELSSVPCAACGTPLAGYRARFIQLA